MASIIRTGTANALGAKIAKILGLEGKQVRAISLHVEVNETPTIAVSYESTLTEEQGVALAQLVAEQPDIVYCDENNR